MTDIDSRPWLLDLSAGRKSKPVRLLDNASVTSFAFSPDGQHLGLASEEGIAYVFETRSPDNEVARLQHTGRVTAVAFSDDGKYVATASNAQNRFDPKESYPLRVWLLRPEDLLAQAKARTDSLNTPDR
jgi:WD40 repeat protein